jgi:hypothetical protein
MSYFQNVTVRTKRDHRSPFGNSNQILRSLQFPIKILKRIAEIIFLSGDKSSISEPVNSADQELDPYVVIIRFSLDRDGVLDLLFHLGRSTCLKGISLREIRPPR